MESAHRFDPSASPSRPRKSWIELGRVVRRGRDLGYEFLLTEATFAVTLLQVALRYDARHEAHHLRARARQIHDAVERSLHRLGLDDPRAGRISALLSEVRWKLEVAGEELGVGRLPLKKIVN